MKTADLIRGTPVFAHVDEQALTALVGLSRTHRFASGAAIARQGDVWPYLFRINQGGVKAVKVSPEGRLLIVASFHADEIFWGMAFFLEDAPMPASLVAEGDAELLLWSRTEILPLLLADGQFAWELTKLLVARAEYASEIVEKLAFQPVAGRLARLLLDQSIDLGGAPLPRSLTLDELAARIGSTREVVSRVLHQFSDDGIIKVTRSEFTLEDPGRLNDLAQKAKG